MINEPLVSICTPCYNHERYLDDYFRSIANQTYSNLELIIIDDASRDNSPIIIEKWIKKLKNRFKRIVFIKQKENKGMVYNCNKLIKLAQGEYIKLFASDDVMLKNCIYDSVMFLETHPEYALCYSNAYSIPDSFKYKYISQIYRYAQIKGNAKLTSGSKKNIFLNLMKCNFILAPTVLIRKCIYDIYGLYDLEIGFEDYEYWLRISLKEKLGYLDRFTIGYRKSITSISRCLFNDVDKEKKYKFMYTSAQKTRKKYLKYLSQKTRNLAIKNFYYEYFGRALMQSNKNEIIRLYKIIKKRNIKLSFKLKLKYLMYKCRVLKFFGYLRNKFSKI